MYWDQGAVLEVDPASACCVTMASAQSRPMRAYAQFVLLVSIFSRDQRVKFVLRVSGLVRRGIQYSWKVRRVWDESRWLLIGSSPS